MDRPDRELGDMSGTKPKASGELPDLSHHPTRKVDSMSALVAEMLLRDPDADVTSPGLPAVNADAVNLDAADESAANDAVGLDMARLIEVRSTAAPVARRAFVSSSSSTSSFDDSMEIPTFRSRKRGVIVLIAALCVVAVVLAAALSLSQGCGA
jgi:hypothetical protein